jgi:hypothetical protein
MDRALADDDSPLDHAMRQRFNSGPRMHRSAAHDRVTTHCRSAPVVPGVCAARTSCVAGPASVRAGSCGGASASWRQRGGAASHTDCGCISIVIRPSPSAQAFGGDGSLACALRLQPRRSARVIPRPQHPVAQAGGITSPEDQHMRKRRFIPRHIAAPSNLAGIEEVPIYGAQGVRLLSVFLLAR